MSNVIGYARVSTDDQVLPRPCEHCGASSRSLKGENGLQPA